MKRTFVVLFVAAVGALARAKASDAAVSALNGGAVLQTTRATASPTVEPTVAPTIEPTVAPTVEPTAEPTIAPTLEPTLEPTVAPTTNAPSEPPTIPDLLADPDAKRILRAPIAQLSSVGWMAGTWHSIREVVRTSKFVPQAKASGTYVFAYTMKGRWLFGADGRAVDFIYLTYDPFAEQWVLARLDRSPSYGIMTSRDGWRDNRIAFTSDLAYAGGTIRRRRLTIVRRSNAAMTFLDEEQRADASWVLDGRTELTKLPQ